MPGEMICGLLGRRLGHSYSPRLHSFYGDYKYELFEKEPDELEEFIKHGKWRGLNVTIPYKKEVLPFADIISDTVKRTGTCNTLVRRDDGLIEAHNTDAGGFGALLDAFGIRPDGRKVLVLGNGGAAPSVCDALKKRGAYPVIISRKGEENYENVSRHRNAKMIVNTTPVGMYPDTGKTPLDIKGFPMLSAVIDIIYNPARTLLMSDAEKAGITAVNGLYMLAAQARESAELFLGHKIPYEKADEACRALRAEMMNIILIGMPGCGKSTVATILGKKTGRKAVDADKAFADLYGMTPAETIETEGEDGFRRKETSLLSSLGKESGLVIATGGGCVTREENYPLLHQNGVIICLERSLKELVTEGRPLSRGRGVESLYRERKALYRRFADRKCPVKGTPEETADRVLDLYLETVGQQ